jgi:sortase (surface protein transpeptidase)
MNTLSRRLLAFALLLVLVMLPATPRADAQSARRCFRQTGYCIAGPIRAFWERNGGLPVFGLPITPQQIERIEGRSVEVQWFERSRLEVHPENPAPYDVLIGRMGEERLRQQRLDWKKFPRAGAPQECQPFATGHSVCGGFLTAWRANGLDLDGDAFISEQESLALFGLPLSGERQERLSDGRSYTVQWFERARFEWHPENPAPYDVLFGLLGRELSPKVSAPPEPVRATAAARLVIDSIGVDYRVVGVGMDARGDLVVPDHDVGWYADSAVPGNGDNVVFWAHVLRFENAPGIPAPFEHLKDLPIGARVTVYDDAGDAHQYAVTHQIAVTPDQVEYILPVGRERVTMVSCYGKNVIVNGSVVDMSHRLITIAEPV